MSAGASRAGATASGLVSLDNPVRLVDTRPGYTTVDGRYAAGGQVRAGSTTTLAVDGRGGIASNAVAVSLVVSAITPAAPGYLVAYACDVPRPATGSLHYGQTTSLSNATMARISSKGTVCVYSSAATHLTVDTTSYYAPSSVTALASPVRIVDSRVGARTADGQGAGGGPRPAGSTTEVVVAGRVGIPSSAASVFLDVSPVRPSTAGYLTVYPCGVTRPTASTVNFVAGSVTDGAALVKVGAFGRVCIYTSATTDVAVEAIGALPSTTYVPLTTTSRLMDSRPPGVTVDGAYARTGNQSANSSAQLPVAGRGGVPTTATAALVNVFSLASPAPSTLNFFVHGPSTPLTYDLIYPAGVTSQATVIAPLGSDGSVCLGSRGTTAVVVDVVGYFQGTSSSGATSACPSTAVNTSPDAVRNQVVGRAAMQVARGTDTVAVVVCHVPTGYPGYENREPLPAAPTAAAVASAANAAVTPYFRNISGGAYSPTFVAYSTPTITLRLPSGNQPIGPDACLAQAQAVVSAAGYTNVFATDDRDVDLASYSGLGGPGITTPTEARDVLHRGTPAVTQRGLWVEGGSVWNDPDSLARARSERQFFNAMIVAHELGHTINWPHSHLGDDEYDNPLDVMSGNLGGPGDGWCNFFTKNQPPAPPEGFSAPCKPQNALAYDRMAAGWMTAKQSVVSSGVTNYLLDAANSTAANTGGTQIVTVVDKADTQSVLTVEGRDAVGYDADVDEPYCAAVDESGQCQNIPGKAGVAVHLVRQDLANQTGLGTGVGLQRRAAQATGDPYSFDHVLVPGQSVTVGGVHITVYPKVGNAYPVRVWGSYTTPDVMKDPPPVPSAARRAAPATPATPATPGTPATGLNEDGEGTPRPPRVSF